jgi:serine palmitoyltransferase
MHKQITDKDKMKDESVHSFTLWTTYFGYLVLVVFGHIRDLMGRLTGKSRYASELLPSLNGGLVNGWERFYTRRLFNRIQDCWARPVIGRPSTWIEIASREFTPNQRMRTEWSASDKVKRVLNLGSYNYLGFADEDWEKVCGLQVREGLAKFGVAVSSGPISVGAVTFDQRQLEKEVSEFVGKDDAIIFGTGYATNAWTISKLVGPGSLIVSDSLNHTSIVNGCRASGAKTVTFQHNDAEDLAKVIEREAFSDPQSTPKRILVVVEGLYSMEGQVCNLKAIVDVCKKMKAFLYVDEAHSIGALGSTGRGICELAGVNPNDVDILMGTFTKSFGGLGGYIASSRSVCNLLRVHLARDSSCRSAMSPVVCSQVRRSLYVLRETEIGKRKILMLKENSMFFREELKRMGCTVLGDDESPIIPVMLYHPAKIAAFSRECLARGLAVVVVGSPAVPLEGARARFCVSASHSKNDLVWALRQIRQVAIMLNLRYEKSVFG